MGGGDAAVGAVPKRRSVQAPFGKYETAHGRRLVGDKPEGGYPSSSSAPSVSLSIMAALKRAV